MMRTSVLIADDPPLSIAGIRRVLDGVPSLDVVAEVGDGEQALVALRSVLLGHRYISPALTDLVLQRRAGKPIGPRNGPMNKLSPSELRVLGLIAEPRTSREIADTLCISQRTVENHRAHISTKLRIQGSYRLLKFALENRSWLTLSKTTQAD